MRMCKTISFNSWNNYFKAPFGALKVNEGADIKVIINDKSVYSINLIIEKEDENLNCYEVKRINLEGPYFNSVKEVYNLNNLRLEPKIFEKDALIYTNIDSINLKSNKSKDYININFKDFPLVGIWTPYYKDTNSTAPFVCIEPWFGLADSVNSDKIYTNKAYINKLKPLESFNSLYTITIEKE